MKKWVPKEEAKLKGVKSKRLAALRKKAKTKKATKTQVLIHPSLVEDALDRLGAKLDEKLETTRRYREALEDMRDAGGRFDVTPTTILSPGPMTLADADGKPYGYSQRQVQEFSSKIHAFYYDYLKRIDEGIRDRARIALGEKSHNPLIGARVVAQIVYTCVVCNRDIDDGAMIGMGDGTGQRFAHTKCARRAELANKVDSILEGTGVAVDREKMVQFGMPVGDPGDPGVPRCGYCDRVAHAKNTPCPVEQADMAADAEKFVDGAVTGKGDPARTNTAAAPTELRTHDDVPSCEYCGEAGHVEKVCPVLKQDEAAEAARNGRGPAQHE